MRRAIASLFLSTLALPAATFSLGRGFRYLDPEGSVRFLEAVDTAQWRASELEALLAQLRDPVREEKDGERQAREAAVHAVAAALASGDHLEDGAFGLIGRLEPGPRVFSALAWDGSTRPPSLVGCNTHEGVLVRQHLDGTQTLLAHLDPESGTWVRSREHRPPPTYVGPLGIAPPDAPRGLLVDAGGAIDFTTDKNRLYRIDADGVPRLLLEWPLPGHSRPFLGWLSGTCDLAPGPEGSRFIADHFGGRILKAAPGPEGTWRLETVAGNGGGYGWREEAADARTVGMSPLGVTAGAEGLLFVESATNELRRLRPGAEAWRLEPVPAKGGDLLSLQYQSAVRLVQCRWTRRLATLDGGGLALLDPHARTLQVDGTTRALAGLEQPGSPGGYFQVAPIPGGLVLLDAWGKPLFLETPAPRDALAALVGQARAAAWMGDGEGRARALEAIAALGRTGGVRVKDLHDPASTEGIMGLPDDLLGLVDGYAQDPSLAWRVPLALRILAAEAAAEEP